MNNTELKNILHLHKRWLSGDDDGVRANLRGVDLRGVDLRGVDLRGADLRGVDLRGVDLRGADLRGANLMGAKLMGANLMGANLMGAKLMDAKLMGANLMDANLMDADLRGVDLRGVDLMDADLRGVDLRGADLMGVSGNRKEIKSLFVFEQYPITYTADQMQIGCERHPIGDWWEFDDQRILEMDGKAALKFWREWKEMIRAIIEKSPAVKTGHEGEYACLFT